MKKVKVRIALAIDSEGQWCGNGWSTDMPPAVYAEEVFDGILDQLAVDDGVARYWLEAEVDMPCSSEPAVVAASVIPEAP